MAATVTITNLTLRPIWVPLHSGENLRLQPGRTAEPVDEVEVKGNIRFGKLLSLRMVAVAASTDIGKKQDVLSKTNKSDGPKSSAEKR